jgi:hypothetical protein
MVSKTLTVITMIIDFSIELFQSVYDMIGLSNGHVYSVIYHTLNGVNQYLHAIWDVDNATKYKEIFIILIIRIMPSVKSKEGYYLDLRKKLLYITQMAMV